MYFCFYSTFVLCQSLFLYAFPPLSLCISINYYCTVRLFVKLSLQQSINSHITTHHNNSKSKISINVFVKKCRQELKKKWTMKMKLYFVFLNYL